MESRPLLKDLDTLPNWHLPWIFEMYANQKGIKAPVSQQSLQWWILITVFHFASQVDGKVETLLLTVFLKVVQGYFPCSPSIEEQLLLCVSLLFQKDVFFYILPLPSVLPR